jgi:hypothetical protein
MARSPRITHKLLLEGDPLEVLKLKLLEVRQDRDLAKKSGKAWTTVSSLHRLECDLLRQLAELRTSTAQVDPLDSLSDEELEALATGAPASQEVEAPEAPALRLVSR